jgi:hypothetical protein
MSFWVSCVMVYLPAFLAKKELSPFNQEGAQQN